VYFDGDFVRRKTYQEQILHLFQCILTAPGISWYMYALVTWRVLGWALLSIRPVARMTVSVILMVISGYCIDSPGYLRNALVYLPIFTAGQLFPLKEVMARLPSVTPPMLIAGGSLLFLVGYWEFSTTGLHMLAEIPYYSWGPTEGPPDGYCSFGAFATYWLRGVFRNTLELSKGLVLILFCCPRQDSLLSRLGQYSLYAYLLHPWLQALMNDKLMMRTWRPHPTAHSSATFQYACLIGAVAHALAVNLVLTSWPCRVLFRWIIEPTWLERLFATEPAAKAGKTHSSGAQLQAPKVV
jgi:hypothetical protein